MADRLDTILKLPYLEVYNKYKLKAIMVINESTVKNKR